MASGAASARRRVVYGAVDGVRGLPLHAPRPPPLALGAPLRPRFSAASSPLFDQVPPFPVAPRANLGASGYSVAGTAQAQPFVGQLPHAYR